MQAPAYKRKKNFLDNSSNATDHNSINVELDNAASSINALRENVALLQQDDGELKAKVVKISALSDEVLKLMTGTDVLTIEGPMGPVGPSFNASYKGLSSERTAFNGEAKGFSFLAMDTGFLYYKLSNASGDWSTGYAAGKGDKGDKGDTGANGINGVNGLITSVDSTEATVNITGQTYLSITPSVVNGQLRISFRVG